jgi:hypothetical protein
VSRCAKSVSGFFISEKDKMKLSIIIVNYNSRVYLERCLSSVFAKLKNQNEWEVIIVNNGNERELLGLKDFFPKIKIRQNQRNTGFGGANNLGAQMAQGELLFFLNPDTEMVSQNISQVLDEFKKEPELGILGSKLETIAGVTQKWTAGNEIGFWNVLKNNLGISSDRKYWQSEKKIEVAWVAGTAFFIRKELFLQLDGFDSRFFMYFEDADLCRRARLLGKKVVYFPLFSIMHHGGKSFLERKKQKKAYYQSQDFYFKKHRGFFEQWILKILRSFTF